MKKKTIALLTLALLVLAGAFYGCKKDEEDDDIKKNGDTFLASTTPEKKAVLIELFTGVRCGFCPDGASRAKEIYDNNPGKAAVIGVHSGSYAAPQAGWPDFTTQYGAAIATMAKVGGYPAGAISRTLCSELGVSPQNANGYSMSRSHFAAASTVILGQDAPVNIGAKATYEAGSRKLTVKVDLYYTAAVSGSNNINVALLQDKIIGKQSGGGDTYEHNNVLRELITGQWGDVVSVSGQEAASKVSKTYTYTVPQDYNGATIPPGGGAVVVNDLKLVVFVANGQADVLNAKVVKID